MMKLLNNIFARALELRYTKFFTRMHIVKNFVYLSSKSNMLYSKVSSCPASPIVYPAIFVWPPKV